MDLEDYKRKSIVEVAQSLGIELKRISSHLYEHPDHDSFRIFANTNTFKWFSRDIQGDAIDFVRVTQNVSFKEALHYLAGQEFKAQEVQEISGIPFSYPLYQVEAKSFRLARAYLKEGRGLSDETINFFGRQGVLAQASWITRGIKEPVVVFKSLDHRSQIQGARLQGIHESSLHQRGRLKKIIKGSHGHIGVCIVIGQPKSLVFCESVIDLMSYYELHKDSLSNVRLVSMEGLKTSVIAYQTLRLIAEEHQKLDFLDNLPTGRLVSSFCAVRDTTDYFQNHPDLITLAVDNDRAGRAFSDKLLGAGFPAELDLPERISGQEKADWNDVLKECKTVQFHHPIRKPRQLEL